MGCPNCCGKKCREKITAIGIWYKYILPALSEMMQKKKIGLKKAFPQLLNHGDISENLSIRDFEFFQNGVRVTLDEEEET